MENKEVRINYTNYRNQTSERVIIPNMIYFGSTEHHPERQWLLVAYDVAKKAQRTFALQNISEWNPVEEKDATEEKT